MAGDMILKPAIAHDFSLDPNRIPILIVEDNPETRLIYEKFLRNSRYQPIFAAGCRKPVGFYGSSDQRRSS